MRAVAVLAVFVDHLFQWPSGGFVGVDIFFVLSGFFITGILIRERTETGRLSFENFYIRRVKRILPSALLVLAVTVVGGYFLFPATRAKETLVDALYAALFSANFRFQAIGADYFQEGQPPSPLQHYWSLSIEEQFYFVWPALLAAIFALTRKRRRRGQRTAHRWGLLGAMGAIVFASFGWAMFLSVSDPNSAYFSTFTRLWELGIGALLAIAGPWLARIPESIRPAIAYLGLAGVAAAFFLINSTVQFPAPWAALPVLSTALVVASFHGAPVRGMSPLTNPVARYFGDVSYTLYLWHFPVIILLLAVLPRGPVFYGVALVLSLGLTAVTYRYYENPIRESDWLVAGTVRGQSRIPLLSRPVWAAIGCLAAASAFLGILGINYNDRMTAAQAEIARAASEQSQAPGQQGRAISGQPAAKADPCFGAPAIVNAGCKLRDPEVPLQPPIEGFAKASADAYFAKCWMGKGEKLAKLDSCQFGYEGTDAKRIALVGDSHAMTIFPALAEVLERNKWQITSYVGYTCQLATPFPDSQCEAAMSEVIAELLARPYDLVLTTGWTANPNYPPATSYETVWKQILATGSHLAVVADFPANGQEAIDCLTRVGIGGDRTGDCGMPKDSAVPSSDPLVAAAQAVPGTTLIDLTRYFCNADRCPSVIGNVIVYRDLNNHLTETFAQTLGPAMEEAVQRALSEPMESRATPVEAPPR
jgi:peptidoglycan/LPS O-acetylase OafA/YrhL